jgi:hypothetical protein
VELARNHVQRDYDHPKDLPLTPISGKELIGYRRLVVRLSDSNKELASEVITSPLPNSVSHALSLSLAWQLTRLKNRESINNSIACGEEIKEQRILYLRNAFRGFVRAKEVVEVQHLGRVICTILNYPMEEQKLITDTIANFAPAIVSAASADSFSNQLTSFFEKSFFT